jgi:hypothetical protein
MASGDSLDNRENGSVNSLFLQDSNRVMRAGGIETTTIAQ